MNWPNRVVVTGTGIVSPLGLDSATYWANLKEGKSGIGAPTVVPAELLQKEVIAEIKDFDPKAYFERDDGAVVSLVAHIDRIPADLRTFVFGQLELGVNGARKKNADNESPAEQKLKNVTLDMILAGTKGVIDDG